MKSFMDFIKKLLGSNAQEERRREVALGELSRAVAEMSEKRSRKLLLEGDSPLRGGVGMERWPNLKSLMGASKDLNKKRAKGQHWSPSLSESEADHELLKMMHVWKLAGYPLGKPFSGGSAIQNATVRGKTKVVAWLLENGVGPEGNHPHETAPLAVAARKGNWQMMEMLLAAGASPLLGQPARAAESGMGAKGVWAMGPTEENVLSAAARSSSALILDNLLRADWGPWEKDKDGEIIRAQELLARSEAFGSEEDRAKAIQVLRAAAENRLFEATLTPKTTERTIKSI